MSFEGQKEETVKDVILRRAHRNPNGDWNVVEKKVREVLTKAVKLDDVLKEAMDLDKSIRKLLLEAYEQAPIRDCLFYDSPVSPAKQTVFLGMYLKKLGWDGVKGIFMHADIIPPFSKQIKDSCKWLLKFKDEKTT